MTIIIIHTNLEGEVVSRFKESDKTASIRERWISSQRKRRDLSYESEDVKQKVELDFLIQDLEVQYKTSLRKEFESYICSIGEKDVFRYVLSRYERVTPVMERFYKSIKPILILENSHIIQSYWYTSLIITSYCDDLNCVDYGLTMSLLKDALGKKSPDFDKNIPLKELHHNIMSVLRHQTDEKIRSKDVIFLDNFVRVQGQIEKDKYGFGNEWYGRGVTLFGKKYGECSMQLMIVGFQNG